MRWKQHPRYVRHMISDEGHVARIKTGNRLNGYIDEKGYRLVRIDWKLERVHRLVLEAFVGPCPPRHEGAHLNGNPQDNRLENLAWKTPAANQADRVAHGTSNRGRRNPMYKHGGYAQYHD